MTYEQLDAAYKAAKERADEFNGYAKRYGATSPNHPQVMAASVSYMTALVVAEAFAAARDVTSK
jgi:hypothetical protein